MMMIKQLANDIACNVREAADKIETAYSLKSEHPSEAAWYKEMAAAHLNFNNKGHDLVTTLINNYQSSSEYKEHPEYADGMMAVWNSRHADIIVETARVKAMIDTFK